MKIITSLSKSGNKDIFVEMLHALAVSIKKNSPESDFFCITDIEDTSIFPENCTVIFHKLCFESGLRKANYKYIWNADVAIGSFMRTEIPLIAENMKWNDKCVLYLDADVMVLKDLEHLAGWFEQNNVKYFAVAPDEHRDDFSMFNAGVMLMNLEGMKKTHSDFFKYCEKMNFEPKNSVVDQGLYSEFYKDKWSRLPYVYNHKAYKELLPEEDPFIVHFQGPKPQHILGEVEIMKIYDHVHTNNRNSFMNALKWHSEFRVKHSDGKESVKSKQVDYKLVKKFIDRQHQYSQEMARQLKEFDRAIKAFEAHIKAQERHIKVLENGMKKLSDHDINTGNIPVIKKAFKILTEQGVAAFVKKVIEKLNYKRKGNV